MRKPIEINEIFSGAFNDRAKTYGTQRRCKVCKQKLNRYNPNKYCHTHEIEGRALEDLKILKRLLKYQKQALRKKKLKQALKKKVVK